MRDAGDHLLAALLRLAGGEEAASCRSARSVPWMSNIYSGARHCFTLWLTGPDAPSRAAALTRDVGDIEFALPGHIVADILVDGRCDGAEGSELIVEALTIEEA